MLPVRRKQSGLWPLFYGNAGVYTNLRIPINFLYKKAQPDRRTLRMQSLYLITPRLLAYGDKQCSIPTGPIVIPSAISRMRKVLALFEILR